MNGKQLNYLLLALGMMITMLSDAALAVIPVTPIQHVIVVIGENVTFDTLYGAYIPAKGQKINNLLSRGIINADGTPGRNFAKAIQRIGFNQADEYTVKPALLEPYPTLPQPLQAGILTPSFQFLGGTPDSRFPSDLPNGPFQITKYVPYGSADSATGDPVHRFFQMWQ